MHSAPFDNHGLPAEVVDALRRGAKIEAIKLLRQTRQIDLREAKVQVEAYLNGHFPVAGPGDQTLPLEVVEALDQGSRIEAIKRLRHIRRIGLKEAKEQVETFVGDHPAIAGKPAKTSLLALLMVIVAFGWALATSVDAISSLIVLAHLDGYRPEVFTIDRLRHDSDGEGGLIWGFEGKIAGQNARLYAPHLAETKKPGFTQLQRRFPTGAEIAVWRNPTVTDTLFQGRTLRVIPYTPDLKKSELQRFLWWVKYALAPLLLALFLGRHLSPPRPLEP